MRMIELASKGVPIAERRATAVTTTEAGEDLESAVAGGRNSSELEPSLRRLGAEMSATVGIIRTTPNFPKSFTAPFPNES
jgi:hypothetical protein